MKVLLDRHLPNFSDWWSDFLLFHTFTWHFWVSDANNRTKIEKKTNEQI